MFSSLMHRRIVTASSRYLSSALPSYETSAPAAAAAAIPASLKDVHCVDDFQRLASQILPKDVYEYLASGSDTEATLRSDRAGFQRYALVPRAMRDVSGLSARVENFCGSGYDLSLPVFASPAGVHALVHPMGECATAIACGNKGTVFGHSQHATKSIEEVALAAPRRHRWYQAYILKERRDTYDLVKRAISSGATGIFVTVDSVRFGFRLADARNGFNGLPAGLSLANYSQIRSRNMNTSHGAWESREHAAWDQNTEAMFAEDLSWDDITQLREVIDDICRTNSSSTNRIPLIIKGVMCADDATAAISAGATGVMVSTHGGRQLDSTLGAVEALPSVVRAVKNIDSATPVLLDSGIRNGNDVVKALALGATAVGVGRPVFFSLAVGGIAGVEKMLEILETETETAMALCGARTVADLDESHVVQRRI